MIEAPAVIVHGLPTARMALALCRPVTLLSAEGAAAYAGVLWWQALIGLARAEYPNTIMQDILDCGDSSGRALEALRAHQALLVLRAEDRIWTDIAARAAGQGATLLREPPPALDLNDKRAAEQLETWLSRSK
jgi:hypothetical protein